MQKESPELLTRAAEELALLPEDSAIAALLGDYGVVRAQIRACHARFDHPEVR